MKNEANDKRGGARTPRGMLLRDLSWFVAGLGSGKGAENRTQGSE